MTHLVWLICHIIYDEMNELWNACKMHWTASPVFILARDIMCHMISRDVTWCHVNRCILQRLWHWANTNGGFWLVPRNGSSRIIFELIENQFSSLYQSQFSSKTSPDSGHFRIRVYGLCCFHFGPVFFLGGWNWSWYGPVRIWWKLVYLVHFADTTLGSISWLSPVLVRTSL